MLYPYLKSALPFLDSTNIHSVYDYKFEWTADHLTDEQLDCYRYSFDEIASEAIDSLDLEKSQTGMESTTRKLDLFEHLSGLASKGENQIINKFWNEAHTVPEWVDWDAIARGQDVLYRYVGPAWFALNLSSLLGGMGSARIVETLSKTGGFSPRFCRKRILETSQFVMQCTMGPDSLKPGQAGHVAALRVRLLHAQVRQKILALAKSDPTYFDVGRIGIPINDQDSIGTILAFSANLIWIAFPLQGIFLRQQEVEDYTALWRLIAHYMGTPAEPFANPRLAKIWMESVIESEIKKPSDNSRIIANNIIASLANQGPYYASADYLRAQTYWLNGPKLATALGISRPTTSAFVLTSVQIIAVSFLSYIFRSVKILDEWNIRKSRKFFYEMIVLSRDGLNGKLSTFGFRYVPSYGVTLKQADGKMGLGLWNKHSMERKILAWLTFIFALLAVFLGVLSSTAVRIAIVPAVFQKSA